MENLTYIGLSQQMALSRQMDMVANNIANMNTPGFKAQGLLFKEYVNDKGPPGSKISLVEQVGSYRNLVQGSMMQTSNPLDAAIEGDGYFAVQTPEGTRYTRNGSFSLNGAGEIVTKEGYQLIGSGGPLIVPQEAGQVTIMENGEVATEDGTIGKLKLVSFDNPQGLVAVGHNLFDAKDAPEQPVAAPRVRQGMLEGSNVQPVVEMNRMIQVSRMYQSAQRLMMSDHEAQRKMIQHMTQV
jgi:flagellar basal-body rod protein FlgF